MVVVVGAASGALLEHRNRIRKLVLRRVVWLALGRLLHRRLREVLVQVLRVVLVGQDVQVDRVDLVVVGGALGALEAGRRLWPSGPELAAEELDQIVELLLRLDVFRKKS